MYFLIVCTKFNPTRFTKDLKPQDINLSFFSGKGELNNLELDPCFLNEILQLPPWIEFQSAVCDNIKAKVNVILLLGLYTWYIQICELALETGVVCIKYTV